MLSIPILARLLGSNGSPKPEAQHKQEEQIRVAAFRIDPAMRYYVLGDWHLEPDAASENAALLRLLGRLLTEGGIGGVFLMGDVAARPGIRWAELAQAHPKLFDTLYRLALATPVYLIQGECDLGLQPPEWLRVVERFEDERWILVHGYQFDPAVEVLGASQEGAPVQVRRNEPDRETTLARLRELRAQSGKQIAFGHLHRAGYVESGLICVGHWTGLAADYGIIRQGQLYLSQGRV